MVFTTHTPEEAGNEKHDIHLCEKMGYFCNIHLDDVRKMTGINDDEFNTRSNGYQLLKGGDLKEELKALKQLNRKLYIEEMPLSKWFSEEFFETKKLVYIY